MCKVVAIYLGTATACLLLLLGIDCAFVREDRREPQVSAIAFNRVVAENKELREGWWKQRQENAKDLAATAKAIDAEGRERERANRAESQLASIQVQLATAKTLLDAARRDQTRIPLLGDDPQDRIPPQNLPLP